MRQRSPLWGAGAWATRARMVAHVSQSRTEYGLGLQAEVLKKGARAGPTRAREVGAVGVLRERHRHLAAMQG